MNKQAVYFVTFIGKSEQPVIELCEAMRYTPKAIANFFIEAAIRDGNRITPMKVQKLVYFAHGWNLAINDNALINEQVEAWKFGPVIRSLYKALAAYGNAPITEKIVQREWVPPRPGFDDYWSTSFPEIHASDSATKLLLEKIRSTYGDYTAAQLSNLTHASGSPWDQVYQTYHGNLPRGTDIPTDTIKKYFREQASAGR